MMMKLLNIKQATTVFILVVLALFMAGTNAQSCANVTTDTTITSACTGSINWTGGNLTIGSNSSGPVSVSGNFNIIDTVGAGSLGAFSNTSSGTIGAGSGGSFSKAIIIQNGVSLSTLDNAGTISVDAPAGYGVINAGSITTLTNSGSITNASGEAIYITSIGYISRLINSGTVSSGNHSIFLVPNNSGALVGALTNAGTLSSTFGYGIAVGGTGLGITTLNNAQGGNGSSAATTALTYAYYLPTNYNIIVRSTGYYGQLAVDSPSGATTFGIYGGGVAGVAASSLSKGTYSSVLSGITSANLTGATSG